MWFLEKDPRKIWGSLKAGHALSIVLTLSLIIDQHSALSAYLQRHNSKEDNVEVSKIDIRQILHLAEGQNLVRACSQCIIGRKT